LKAGEVKTVQFSLCPDDLAIIDAEGNKMMMEGQIEVSIGGGQPSDKMIAEKKVVKKIINIE